MKPHDFYGKQLSRAQLHQLYVVEGRATTEIAVMVGRNHPWVLRRLHGFGLPVRSKRKYPHPVSDKTLRDMYLKDKMGSREIADIINASDKYGGKTIHSATVLNRLRRAGVKIRTSGQGTAAKLRRLKSDPYLRLPPNAFA